MWGSTGSPRLNACHGGWGRQDIQGTSDMLCTCERDTTIPEVPGERAAEVNEEGLSPQGRGGLFGGRNQ